jgi:1,4-alpha-glucan branching enzyme
MPAATVPSPGHAQHHYPAQQNPPTVNFSCEAPDAREVYLCGDFNDWDPRAHPMQHLPNGFWKCQMALPPGEHHYWFLIDDKPTLDPGAEKMSNELLHHKVSVVRV